MHELSLCEGIIEIIETEAEKQGFQSVKNVWLEIGELAAVDEQAMLFSYEAVSHGTIAELSELHIITLPGKAWCMTCASTVHIKARFEPCPVCGGFQVEVTQGDEMRIKELEVV